MRKKYSECDRVAENDTEREREREREREIWSPGTRVWGMEVRDKTAADRAFLCTGITAARDREHKGISSERECEVWMYGTRRHQIQRSCVREWRLPEHRSNCKRTRFKRGTEPTPHFKRLIVLTVVDGFIDFVYFIFFACTSFLKKNQNAPRPSEHSPVKVNLPC